MEDKENVVEETTETEEVQDEVTEEVTEETKAEETKAEDPIYEEIRATYEERFRKQQEDFDKKLKSREAIIKQLQIGKTNANNVKPSYVEELNRRRTAQNKY